MVYQKRGLCLGYRIVQSIAVNLSCMPLCPSLAVRMEYRIDDAAGRIVKS